MPPSPGKPRTPAVQTYVPPGYATQPPSPTDLGPLGFWFSLAGLFCGCAGALLPMIGLIISAYELRKPPRGLPAAGVVLGVIGLAFWGTILAPYVMVFAGAAGLTTEAMAQQQTDAAIGRAHQTIIDYYDEKDSWPDEKEGAELIAGDLDGWKRPLRYKALPDSFEIRSAGPDGQFDTEDDLTDDYIADEHDYLDDDDEPAVGTGNGTGAGAAEGSTTGDAASGAPPTAGAGPAGAPPVTPPATRPPPVRSNRRSPGDRMFDGKRMPLSP